MKASFKFRLVLTSLLLFVISPLWAQNSFEIQLAGCTSGTCPLTTIERGNLAGASAKLKITSTSGTVAAGNYTFSTNVAGLYVENLTSTAGITTVINTSHNSFTISIPTAITSPAEINFTLWAGQCFAITGNSSAVMNNIYTLKENVGNTNVPLADNSSLQVVNRAFLNCSTTSGDLQGSPDATRTLTYTYNINNAPNYIFNGVLSFKKTAIATSYDIRRITFSIVRNGVVDNNINLLRYDNGTWVAMGNTFANPENANIPNHNNNNYILNTPLIVKLDGANVLNPEDIIRVQEVVQLNGCTDVNRGYTNWQNSVTELQWGNTVYDLCSNNGKILSTTLLNPNGLVQITPNISDATSNHLCYGSNYVQASGEEREVRFRNTGNDVARDFTLHLFADEEYDSPIKIPYNTNDIYVTIIRRDELGNVISQNDYQPNFDQYNLNATNDYTPIYSASNLPAIPVPAFYWTQYGQLDGYNLYYLGARYPYTPRYRVNGVMSAKTMREKVVSKSTFKYSTANIGGDNALMVYDLFISQVRANSSSAWETIQLNPGDEVVLHWKEINCCFFREVINNRIVSPGVSCEYNDICNESTPITSANVLLGNSILDYTFILQPPKAPATTAGEVDRCLATEDGNVERISSQINIVSNMVAPNYLNPMPDGRLVFRFYLQSGLDLDKSLSVPESYNWANAYGYDNVTDNIVSTVNDPTSCVQPGSVGCTPSCVYTNTIDNLYDVGTNPEKFFYVRLRPKAGNYISSVPVLLMSDINIPQPGIAVTCPQAVTPNQELIFDGGEYANMLYEVSFTFAQLEAYYTSIGKSVNGDYNAMLRELMNECYIDFDVRAYCSQIQRPKYKYIMYVDRCSTAPTSYVTTGCSAANLTNMIPVGAQSGMMQVNCPGCRIPGGNINYGTLERAPESRGLADLNNNNVPDDATTQLPDGHPTLQIATYGDVLVSKFQEAMSDGVSITTGQGVLFSELLDYANDAPGNEAYYHLDNLYLKVTASSGAYFASDNSDPAHPIIKNMDLIKVMVNNVVRTGTVVYTTPTVLVLKFNSQDLYGQPYFIPSQSHSFELYFKIVNQISATPQKIEISYSPFYSPCDNCTDIDALASANPVDAGEPLSVTSDLPDDGNPCTIDEVTTISYTQSNLNAYIFLSPYQHQDRTKWMCTAFSNTFTYMPFKQESSFVFSNTGNCEKTITAQITGRFDQHTYDVFFQEFRTFLTDDVLLSIPVPKGYIVSNIQTMNSWELGYAQFYYHTYTTSNASDIAALVTPTTNTDYTTQLNLAIKTQALDENFLSLPFSSCHNGGFCIDQNGLPNGSNYLISEDENYQISAVITLALDPSANCITDTKDFLINDDYYDVSRRYFPKSNIPFGSDYYPNTNIKISDAELAIRYNPSADLSTTSDFLMGVLYNSEPIIKKPNGLLLGSSHDGIVSIDISNSGIIQIPVDITNYHPDNNPLNVVRPVIYPYLKLDGASLAQGLNFVGVYQGYNPSGPPAAAHFYPAHSPVPGDYTDQIIIDIDANDASAMNSIRKLDALNGYQPQKYTYTLVFSYTCSEDCNPAKLCTDNGALALPCLIGNDNLSVEYGWNCSGAVTFDNVDDVCFKSATPIQYDINTTPVGFYSYIKKVENGVETNLDANTNINLDFCTDYTYRANLYSCKLGGINSFDLQFSNVPDGLTITNISTSAGSFAVMPDPNVDNLFHLTCTNCFMNINSGTIDVDFKFSATKYFNTSSVTLTAIGSTYCGPNIIVTQTNPVSVTNIFTGLNTSYCISSPAKTITPAVSGGTYSFPGGANGFTDTGDGTLTFTPSVLGIGNHTFIYQFPNSTCTAVYTIEILNNLPVDITVPPGEATLLCGTHTSVLLTASTKAGTAPYDYLWTGTGVTGNINPSVTATAAGQYTAQITDDNGCTGTRTVTVRDKVDAICPGPFCQGESPLMQVELGGVIGTYSVQWYKVGSSQAQLSAYVTEEGDYYGWVVTPLCTLQTETSCHIQFKPKPPVYSITANGTLNLLPDATVDITGTAPASVATIQSATWSDGTVITDLNNPGTTTASAAGPYSITSVGTNGCTSVSNVLVVNKPQLFISGGGGGCGSNILTVSSNTQDASYIWYFDDGSGQQPVPLTDYIDVNGHSIHAIQNGYYWVENSNAVVSTDYYYLTYNDPLNPGINILSSSEASFVGMEDCANSHPLAYPALSVFGSEYECLSQFPALTNPQPGETPENQYNYLQLPGHYIVVPGAVTSPNGNPSLAGYWNRGLWDAYPISALPDNNYMLVDGAAEATAKKVWSKSGIPVTHNTYYRFAASLMGVDINTPTPVSNEFEFPDYELHITNSWNNRTDIIRAQVFYTYNDVDYIDISGDWEADLTNGSTIPTGGTITISIVLKGGGVIGRDVAVDNVRFAPMSCTAPAPANPRIQDDRICDAIAAVDVEHRYTCAGLPVTFAVPEDIYNNTLQYTWHKVSNDKLSSNVMDNDNDRFFHAPPSGGEYALKVKDPQNYCAAIAKFYVHIITPSVEISSDVSTICAPQDVTFTVEGYDGILGAEYKWYVNNSPVTINATGTFVLTDALLAAEIKCELISGCSVGPVFSNNIVLNGVATTLDAGDDVTICENDNVVLNATGGTGYVWSPSTGLSATNVANPTASPSATTTYSVTATDNNGCLQTDDVIVTVNLNPTVNAGTDVAICSGSSTTLSATGGVNYSWTPSSSLSDANLANPVATPATDIIYTVTALDANNCEGTDDILVTVNTSPTVNTGSDVVICSGQSIALSANSTPSNGGTWSWSPVTGLSSTAVNNPLATVSATTVYTATYTITYGSLTCSGSDNVQVAAIQAPTISVSGTLLTATVVLPPGASVVNYQWYNGATLAATTFTNTCTALTNGNYTVQVLYHNSGTDCSLSSSSVPVVVTAIALPDDSGVSVYPVPASDVLTIEMDGNILLTNVTFQDLHGRVISQQKVTSGSMEFDLTGLSSAVYVLILKDDQGSVYIKKVQVIR